MKMDDFVSKYGTRTCSILMMQMVDSLRARGSDIDSAVVEEMAKDLEEALEAYNFWHGNIKVKNKLTSF